MYRRRRSPYSRIEEIRRSRRQLLGLVLSTIVLGVVLGVLVNGLYEISTLWPAEPLWARGLWIAILVMIETLLAIGIVGVIIWRLYLSTESERVRIDIAIPYHLPGGRHLELAKQHRNRPAYRVATLGRLLFHRTLPPKSSDNHELAATWCEARAQGKPFQSLIYDLNADLVDAILVFALHRHSEGSLGPEAKYDWWQVDLRRHELTLDELPTPLSNNQFLRTLLGAEDGWKLALPEGVNFQITDQQENYHVCRNFSLICEQRGDVTITRLPHVWVAKQSSQPAQVLSEGISLKKQDDFFVIGTRIEAKATFRYTFLQRTDPFHQWSTDLLAQLEEMLDWGYFSAGRPDRMIADLPWKIGDLPERSDSLWNKLSEIEDKLKRIDSSLESLSQEVQAKKQRSIKKSTDTT